MKDEQVFKTHQPDKANALRNVKKEMRGSQEKKGIEIRVRDFKSVGRTQNKFLLQS